MMSQKTSKALVMAALIAGASAGTRAQEEAGGKAAAEEAGEQAAAEEAGEQAEGFARIELKDGSVVVGEVVGMVGGTLTVKTAFGIGETVQVKWSEVLRLETGRQHLFEMEDGSRIKGRASRTENGRIILEGGDLVGAGGVAIDRVKAINPPPKKPLELVGNFNLGVTVTDGNTQTKSANFSASAVAQSEKQRLSFRAAWNYSEDGSGITARNTTGSVKYDYFITKKFFIFASVLLEEDEFQDLNLRTAVSGGPGYQFVSKGDFEEDWLKRLEVYGEAGLAFFNEDREAGEDERFLSARWSFNVDWEFRDGITFFHRHEGYPGLERIDDLYITTEQGIRFKIWGNLVATLQLNWKWDNTPSAGFERSDAQYLATIGYQFRL